MNNIAGSKILGSLILLGTYRIANTLINNIDMVLSVGGLVGGLLDWTIDGKLDGKITI